MAEYPSLTQAIRRGLNQRDAVVFLIDWRQSMLARDPTPFNADLEQPHEIPNSNVFDTNPGSNVPSSPTLLSSTLRVVAHIMRRKLILRENDAVALIAFGVPQRVSTARWPGVYVIRPLKPCDAAGVRTVQALASQFESAHPPIEEDSDSSDEVGVPPNFSVSDIAAGQAKSVQFDKALWAARHQFSLLSAIPANSVHRRRVFILTADDDPCSGSLPLRQLSLTQARDLADLGAILDITLLTTPSHLQRASSSEMGLDGIDPMEHNPLPNASKFFHSLVYADDGSPDRGTVSVATIHSFEMLRERILRRQASKRSLRKTYIVLGRDYKIGVALYAPIRRASRPAKVELVAETNKPAFKITTVTCEAVGDILKPPDIRTMFSPDFVKDEEKRTKLIKSEGDDPAEEFCKNESPVIHGFSPNDVKKIKAIGEDGIVLYGFKPNSALRKEHNLGPSTFVAPDDEKYSGSTSAFAVLHSCMLKRSVIAIAAVRRSATTGMRFAALVAQEEQYADDGELLVAGGMHMHYLPYKDDIYTQWRKELPSYGQEAGGVGNDNDDSGDEESNDGGDQIKVEIKEENVLHAELVRETPAISAARRMVRKLKLKDYNTSTFANPDLQRFYCGLEMAAGVETSYNPRDDLLTPGTELMRQKAGHLLSEIKRLDVGVHFDGEAVASRFGTKTSKRAAETNERLLRKQLDKLQKQEAAAAECEDDLFIQHFQSGSLESLRVKDLQTYCTAHGINQRGPKKSLVIAVEDHLAQRKQAGELPEVVPSGNPDGDVT